eukprot:g3679.t1 g3679   contig12:2544534-2545157(-)
MPSLRQINSSLQLASSVYPPDNIPSSITGDSKENEGDPMCDNTHDDDICQRKHTTRNLKSLHHTPEHLHVLIFNRGLQTEGLHTIEFPKHSGSNVALAFETYKDCQRFAPSLSEEMGIMPVPQEIASQRLKTWAISHGMTMQVIPDGTSLKPPSCSSIVGENDEHFNFVEGMLQLEEHRSYLKRLIGDGVSYEVNDDGSFGEMMAWG